MGAPVCIEVELPMYGVDTELSAMGALHNVMAYQTFASMTAEEKQRVATWFYQKFSGQAAPIVNEKTDGGV